MKIATQRSGLSPHVLRVWEKRYAAVTPHRSSTNRRLYSDEEIHKLQLLHQLTEQGHSISQIAKLDNGELMVMAQQSDELTPIAPDSGSAEIFVERAREATQVFDMHALERVFDEAIVQLGYSALLERVMVPFIQLVGQDWQDGHISTAEEHAASHLIKDYLARTARPFTHDASAPCCVVATPSGQLHEIGAVIASSMAKKMGWNVLYLGPSLPAEEIAGACIHHQAKALCLSIVYPLDDPHLPAELERLRKHLPAETPIIIGGRASFYYQKAINKIDATLVESMPELRQTLDQLRTIEQ
ncbi:MerR family transcriptional regulator [Persicirhabdus sediminis]|uniref:MerR family transcriptional regulator n=1 Tax=Persicirhabdus sediminis TaxID=454144 RepID=A0A8J7SL33_9BACT|nr:MerR family transcriptional regulator [Persicirhabdus sediminis]MBK1792524.1 MerR family transcriptional regulator [Persicirhabdus sediminis]